MYSNPIYSTDAFYIIEPNTDFLEVINKEDLQESFENSRKGITQIMNDVSVYKSYFRIMLDKF
jgi:hypothetical protein